MNSLGKIEKKKSTIHVFSGLRTYYGTFQLVLWNKRILYFFCCCMLSIFSIGKHYHLPNSFCVKSMCIAVHTVWIIREGKILHTRRPILRILLSNTGSMACNVNAIFCSVLLFFEENVKGKKTDITMGMNLV